MKKKKSLLALGMKYPVLSQANSLQVDTPDSMGFEISQALENLKNAIGGDVDAFVQQRLKYPSKQALFKALSAEQIDAVALAIYNIETKGQGIIVADQTGIGKGRIAAGVLRYAHKQGIKPIFITEKPNLFSDLYRDMRDIGCESMRPFILNAKETKTQIKDAQGEVLYSPPIKAIQDKIIQSARLTEEFDLVMLTYSQVSDAQGSPKINFLTQVAQGSILILDEAHNASGMSNTGQVLMNVCMNARGVTFLSATFAKRPDNMPLYAMKTCISEVAVDSETLVNAFQKGGVALQEVVASQLASQGQLIRRERLFEGIEVNYLPLDKNAERDRKTADGFTSIVRDIITFQKEYIIPEIEQLDKRYKSSQSQAMLSNGQKEIGVNTSPAFSRVFMLVNQMLFALKADDVANQAIQRLQQGKKPVIAFSSTMGSFLENMEDDQGFALQEGSVISASFASVLQKTLQSVLGYSVKDEVGKVHKKYFDITQMSIDARENYFNIYQKIEASSGNLCLSPIDYIKQKIEAAGYSVAEVTGRKLAVNLSFPFQNTSLNGLGERVSDFPRTASFQGTIIKRKAENVNDSFRKFNNNQVDVLMINQSGSTGASAHAIPTALVANEQVKQRVMIVLQAELDINTEVQKRGRINRTGQILKPIYDYLISSIPAEKRMMMMLQKKLKSLDANTTANQRNSESLMKSEDFLNKYGDQVVAKYLEDNPELAEQLDDPLNQFSERETVILGAASKVSGRVAVLPVLEQEKFYTEILERYHEYIKQLIEDDKFDLEVETQDLKAKTLAQKVLQVGRGGKSPFSDNTFLETCEVNVLRKPLTISELQTELQNALAGQTPLALSKLLVSQAKESFEKTLAADIDKINTSFSLRRARITAEKAYQILEPAKQQEYIAKRAIELREAEKSSIQDKKDKNANELNYVVNLLEYFKVGMILRVPDTARNENGLPLKTLATCLGFKINYSKEKPFAPANIGLRIAIASSKRMRSFPTISGLNSEAIFAIKGATQDTYFNSYSYQDDLFPLWQKAIINNTKDRGTRLIITGNLIQAYRNTNFSGRLIQFTTYDGKIRKGILVSESYAPKSTGNAQEKVGVPLDKCQKVVNSLMVRAQPILCSNSITIFKIGLQQYALIVSASRQTAGNIYLDEELLALVEKGKFEKISSSMSAVVLAPQMPQVLQLLGKKLKINAELSPEQFALIQGDISTQNQYSDEVKPLPIIITAKVTMDKKKELTLKYKYKLRLQRQLLAAV